MPSHLAQEWTARKKRWRQGRWHDMNLYAILEEDYVLAQKGMPVDYYPEMPSG